MEKDITDNLANLNLNSDIKWELKDYKTISKIREQKLTLPSNESYIKFLKKDCVLSEPLLLEKFKSDELYEINLNQLEAIRNQNTEETIFRLLGSLNKENFPSIPNDVADSIVYIDCANSFETFVKSNVKLLASNHNVKDYNDIMKTLKKMGFDVTHKAFQSLKSEIMKKNQIQIIVSPTDILWLKSTGVFIVDNLKKPKSFDCKLNSYTNLFLNNIFVDQFFKRLLKHPRCKIGFISSMIKKNLVHGIDALKVRIPILEDYNIYDQSAHENVGDANSKKPEFERSLTKLLGLMKNHGFNETNTLILESELDKCKQTKEISIPLRIFTKDMFEHGIENTINGKHDATAIIDYLESLLDNCEDDVRSYINEKPFITNSV